MGRLHQFAGAGGRGVKLSGGRRLRRSSSLTLLGRVVVVCASAVVLVGGFSYWFL